MTASCLMVQGTASGVGKSLLTAAFCRIFSRQGYRVAPFKAQNMALNAAVTADGCEIGRAQAAQAEAAGVEPTVDMNPILLKPEGEDCSQVVVRGRPIGRLTFREYGAQRGALLAVVAESLARLRAAHDLVIIEGAGSPAEINLSAGEIVNMRIARLADAPVVLVGDIDRGGVFAAFVGTLALLEPDDRARVAGFVVNKFRGNLALLAPGLDMLYERTGVPVLGVVPYLERGLVPTEDSLDLDDAAPASGGARLDIVVVRPPRIANFDDVEPLAREPGVRVRFATSPSHLVGADLLIVPGSKSTIADLAWLRESRLADALIAAARAGTPLIGLCGGYQMLGRALEDPDGVESSVTTAAGLGLLPVVTTFGATKRTVRVHARVIAEVGPLAAVRGQTIEGYEIHMGTTRVEGAGAPFSILDRGGAPCGDPDGALAFDGVVIGTYLHGLFANDGLRRALLDWLATRTGVAADPRWGQRESATARYDRLADAVAAAVDLKTISALIGL
ncbi:MAG: cobyric acid synthase CobQ [Candidatus Rokubacteria bacterium 13_1_20CM_4_68_9]|nr:MAG: cobyric acid synthase CobQ [Candidatus Rokubacteria bacterium 13_1_20CM_4_68_9]